MSRRFCRLLGVDLGLSSPASTSVPKANSYAASSGEVCPRFCCCSSSPCPASELRGTAAFAPLGVVHAGMTKARAPECQLSSPVQVTSLAPEPVCAGGSAFAHASRDPDRLCRRSASHGTGLVGQ